MTRLRLPYYRDELGFDRTVWRRPGHYRIGCSQCTAAVINGVPTHEAGCPHATHECQGCFAQVPQGAQYCADCAD